MDSLAGSIFALGIFFISLLFSSALVTTFRWQVGGLLDSKGYGIAMKHGTPYKPLLDQVSR